MYPASYSVHLAYRNITPKKGVISFFLFLSADFSLAVLTYIVSSTSSNPLPDAGMTLLSFCIVTVIWFTASVVYYRKRWSLLQ